MQLLSPPFSSPGELYLAEPQLRWFWRSGRQDAGSKARSSFSVMFSDHTLGPRFCLSVFLVCSLRFLSAVLMNCRQDTPLVLILSPLLSVSASGPLELRRRTVSV